MPRSSMRMMSTKQPSTVPTALAMAVYSHPWQNVGGIKLCRLGPLMRVDLHKRVYKFLGMSS